MAATSENNLSNIARISGGDLTREHRSLTIDNLNCGAEVDTGHFQSNGIRASQILSEVSCSKRETPFLLVAFFNTAHLLYD